MLPELPGRGIHGVHAFSCAMPTRGGICDCQPDTPGDPADPYRRIEERPHDGAQSSLLPATSDSPTAPAAAA